MRKMKESRIAWVGEIPLKWHCKPMRALFIENHNKNLHSKECNALQFKYGNIVQKQNFDADDDEYVANTIRNYNIVDYGTIMINGLNLNFDFVSKRVALVRERGVITSAYIALEIIDRTELNPMYATYLLKAYDHCMAFHNMGGGVRKILGFDELKRNYFLLPPFVEQEAIAHVLDQKCTVPSLPGNISVIQN